MYDEMLIMRMNPLRIEWRVLFRTCLCQKGTEAGVCVEQGERIERDSEQDAEGADQDSASGKQKCLSTWKGNILATLEQFQKDTEWIYVISARCET